MCDVSNRRHIIFQWIENGKQIENTTRRFQEDSNMRILRVSRDEDIGPFQCIATNVTTGFSLQSLEAHLNIQCKYNILSVSPSHTPLSIYSYHVPWGLQTASSFPTHGLLWRNIYSRSNMSRKFKICIWSGSWPRIEILGLIRCISVLAMRTRCCLHPMDNIRYILYVTRWDVSPFWLSCMYKCQSFTSFIQSVPVYTGYKCWNMAIGYYILQIRLWLTNKNLLLIF